MEMFRSHPKHRAVDHSEHGDVAPGTKRKKPKVNGGIDVVETEEPQIFPVDIRFKRDNHGRRLGGRGSRPTDTPRSAVHGARRHNRSEEK